MAESGTPRALHNDSLASMTIRAALGGSSPARKAASTPTPMAPHGDTLPPLISIIKSWQPKSPSQPNG
jgi:hypothetical protein